VAECWWCAKGFCCGTRNRVLDGSTVSYSVSCCMGLCIFSLANYILLASLDEYFSTTIFSRWILHVWQFVHAVLEHDDFLKTCFTRLGSNALKVWWDLSLLFCCKFITESNSERILKIGLRFDKVIPPWVWWSSFLEHSVLRHHCTLSAVSNTMLI